MIEEITSSGYSEFSKRYADTLGFLTSVSGKRIVVRVNEVGPRYTQVIDSKGNSFTLNSDKGVQMEFTQVPSQWFQPDKDHIIYVCRRPERQWRRGICSGNTILMAPRARAPSLYNIEVDPEKISQLFYPDVDSKDFEDCQKLHCGLWSKHFAWANTTVWMRNLVIGTVDHKAKTIKLTHVIFEQELRDALIRNNSEYKISNE